MKSTREWRHFYDENGYLVVPDLFSQAEIEELRSEAVSIFCGRRGAVDGLLNADVSLSDAEVLQKYLAIHFPHKISPAIASCLSHPRLIEVLTHLVGPNLKCMQSMLFINSIGNIGGQVLGRCSVTFQSAVRLTK